MQLSRETLCRSPHNLTDPYSTLLHLTHSLYISAGCPKLQSNKRRQTDSLSKADGMMEAESGMGEFNSIHFDGTIQANVTWQLDCR